MKPLRVLHLPKWYPHRYDDQDGDFVARHVAAIAAAAPGEAPMATAVLFAVVAKGPLPRLLVEEVDLSGAVPTWRYYYRARPTGLAPLDQLLKAGLWLWGLGRGLRAVRRHWQGQRADLVHAHILLRPALLAWWLKVWHGIPYVLTEHWSIFLPANDQRRPPAHRRLAGWLVRRAAAFAPVTQDMVAALRRLGGVNPRTVVIPNVVDTGLFQPPPTAAAVRSGLLHVAVFMEQAKNLSGLLRTVARLRTAHPHLGVRLRVAGFGPAESMLHQLAESLGLLADGTVQFLGKLQPAEVAEEMRRAACFVLFSNYESLPCVLIEAQASGLPAVATRVGGIPELLPADNSRGLLVAPGDEEALGAALLAVLQNPGQFDAAALRAHAETHFSMAAVGGQFRRLYQDVVQNR